MLSLLDSFGCSACSKQAEHLERVTFVSWQSITRVAFWLFAREPSCTGFYAGINYTAALMRTRKTISELAAS